MKTRLSGIFFLFFLVSTVVSCRQSGKSGSDERNDSISLAEIKPLVHRFDTMGEGLPIFYNMYLSVEMSTLFETAGAVFEPELLNSPDKVTDYVTSSKKALNLGVYAADLSYSKVFDQFETAGKYFNSMQRMAEELGIPSSYFENTADRFDRNINNKDSLIKIANEVYMATDIYLRENERYGASAQIILGGWLEAMHIAIDIANKTKDLDIIERIAEQRVSLGNVIEMLNNYSEDVAIKENLDKLQQLQPVFDSFVVKVDSKFDPATPAGKKTIEEFLIKLNEIGKQVNQLRAGIIS
ncbi:MAG TPA: hypothetical protein VJ203_05210 [Bacteroidales bacterium]|nr:hypothetical protein [Bacteroidales bacterium]